MQTASAIAASPVPLVVYYARDGLPPFRALALGGVPSRNSVEDRIGARLSALWGVQQPGAVPAGASNPFAKSGRVGSHGQLGTEIRHGKTMMAERTKRRAAAARAAAPRRSKA